MSALGSLVVKLALDHAEYTQGLDRTSQAALKFAQNSQRNFDEAAQTVKQFFSGFAIGAAGVVASFASIDSVITRTKSQIDILASLDDAAQKTGSRIEDLSRIEQVARNFGDDFSIVEAGLSRLAKGLATFDDGSNDTIRALNSIGVSSKDASGNLRTAGDIYIDVAKKLQDFEDGANKTAVANALFGKSGADLLPIINNLAQGIDNARGVTERETSQADQLNNMLAASRTRVDQLFQGMAIDLLPTLINIGNAISGSSTTLQDFNSVSSIASGLLKGLAIAGRLVIDTFSNVGREIGGRAAQLAALGRLDFKGAGFIGEQLTQDFLKSGIEFDKFVDQVLNGDKEIKQQVESGGVKKTLDFVLKLPPANSDASKSFKQTVDASKQFIDSLKKESEQLGKSTFEIKRMEAAKLGVSKVADPLIDKIESETKANKELKDRMDEVKRITDSVATAQEKYNEKLAKLEKLKPDLSAESYSRALLQAQDELNKTQDKTKDTTDQVSQLWVQSVRNIQTTLSNSLFNFFDNGLDGMLQNIKRTVLQIASEFAGLKIGQYLGLDKIMSGKASIGSLFSGGATLNSLFGFGKSATQLSAESGALGLWGKLGAKVPSTGLFGGLGSLGGTSLGAIGGAAAALMASIGIGSSIAGNKKLGGIGGTGMSMIGTVFGGPIGAILGGAINALFGHGPMKFRQQVAMGEASADGFEGRVTDVFRAKGGLFVGNKHKEQSAQNAEELIRLFDDTIKGFSKSASSFAANLGLSADSIAGYSKTIRLESEKGKALTEEAIQKMLTGIGEDFARGIVPEIDRLKKSGESAFDALSRLNSEFSTLVNVGTALGHSLAGTRAFVGSASFTQRSDFIDAAGGMDKLMQNANLFAENFLTVEERLRPAQEKLTEDLGKLGLSADLTREDFKKLALSFGEVGGISQEVFVGLMNSVRDFVEVRAMQDQLKQGVAKEDLSGLRNYFTENFLGLDAQLAPRRAALNEELKKLGLSTDLTREGFIRLVQSFGQVNGVSEEMYVSLLKLAPAYLEVINAQDLLQQQQRQGLLDNLASAYNDLEKSVSKSRTDATNRYNDALKPINERIQTLNNSVGKLKSLSDALKSTLESIRPITRDQAKQQLRDALSGKSPLDIDNLRGALSAVDKISLKYFGSTFDFEEERRRTANLVDALKGKTDKALTTEEKMLRSTEDQKELLDEGFKNEMSRLDSILDQAKNQVNASNNLSTSIKSLADAIAGFNLRAVQAGVPTIGNGSVSGNPNISDQQIRDFIKTPGLTDMDIYNAAKKHGVSFQQYADATGQKVEDLYAWADKNRLKRFAKGGMHSGGLRIVGELGPELEFTGPSRIASNSEFKNLLRSDDLSSDIKELTRQIKKVVSFTKNTSNKLDQVTRNGTAIRTKGVA